MFALIHFIGAMIIMAVLLTLAWALLQAVLRLFAFLLKLALAAFAIGAAGLAGGGLTVLATSGESGGDVALAALAGGGLVVLAMAIWLRSLFVTKEQPGLPEQSPEPDPQPYTPPEPDEDSVVRDAWASAETLFPTDTERLRTLRQPCARALRAVREDGFDTTLIDAAVTVRRHVPALVDSTAQLLADANVTEREALREELFVSLAAIATRAGTAADAFRKARCEAIDLRHAHVRRRY